MRKTKFLGVLVGLIVAVCALPLGVLANSAEPEEPSNVVEGEVSEPVWSEVALEFINNANINVTINYTYDSALFDGMSYETYVDILTKEAGVKIVDKLPIGYMIYDDLSTPHIEGIRVNGEAVTSLNIPIDITADAPTTAFTVDVKLVYAEGLLGDIARICDGTYDWTSLLSNPIMVVQIVYYILAVLSVCIGIVAFLRNKNKSVKTADEIASKVSECASSELSKIREQVVEVVMAEATPVLNNIMTAAQNVVKAVALSTSTSKEAPIALLDTLKDVSSVDVSKIIDEVRENVSKSIEEAADTKSAELAALHSIAKRTTELETESVAADVKSVF